MIDPVMKWLTFIEACRQDVFIRWVWADVPNLSVFVEEHRLIQDIIIIIKVKKMNLQ